METIFNQFISKGQEPPHALPVDRPLHESPGWGRLDIENPQWAINIYCAGMAMIEFVAPKRMADTDPMKARQAVLIWERKNHPMIMGKTERAEDWIQRMNEAIEEVRFQCEAAGKPGLMISEEELAANYKQGANSAVWTVIEKEAERSDVCLDNVSFAEWEAALYMAQYVLDLREGNRRGRKNVDSNLLESGAGSAA